MDLRLRRCDTIFPCLSGSPCISLSESISDLQTANHCSPPWNPGEIVASPVFSDRRHRYCAFGNNSGRGGRFLSKDRRRRMGITEIGEMNGPTPRVSVVIPCFNEQDNVQKFLLFSTGRARRRADADRAEGMGLL